MYPSKTVANSALKPIKSLLVIRKCSDGMDLQQGDGEESLSTNEMVVYLPLNLSLNPPITPGCLNVFLIKNGLDTSY